MLKNCHNRTVENDLRDESHLNKYINFTEEHRAEAENRKSVFNILIIKQMICGISLGRRT